MIVCFVLAVVVMELRLWDVIVSWWLNVIGELDVDILVLTMYILFAMDLGPFNQLSLSLVSGCVMFASFPWKNVKSEICDHYYEVA